MPIAIQKPTIQFRHARDVCVTQAVMGITRWDELDQRVRSETNYESTVDLHYCMHPPPPSASNPSPSPLTSPSNSPSPSPSPSPPIPSLALDTRADLKHHSSPATHLTHTFDSSQVWTRLDNGTAQWFSHTFFPTHGPCGNFTTATARTAGRAKHPAPTTPARRSTKPVP